MGRTVPLGTLEKGDPFTFMNKRYVVAQNLGEAGVSVRTTATREVRIGDRKFDAPAGGFEVWSGGSPVEIGDDEKK